MFVRRSVEISLGQCYISHDCSHSSFGSKWQREMSNMDYAYAIFQKTIGLQVLHQEPLCKFTVNKRWWQSDQRTEYELVFSEQILKKLFTCWLTTIMKSNNKQNVSPQKNYLSNKYANWDHKDIHRNTIRLRLFKTSLVDLRSQVSRWPRGN